MYAHLIVRTLHGSNGIFKQTELLNGQKCFQPANNLMQGRRGFNSFSIFYQTSESVEETVSALEI